MLEGLMFMWVSQIFLDSCSDRSGNGHTGTGASRVTSRVFQERYPIEPAELSTSLPILRTSDGNYGGRPPPIRRGRGSHQSRGPPPPWRGGRARANLSSPAGT